MSRTSSVVAVGAAPVAVGTTFLALGLMPIAVFLLVFGTIFSFFTWATHPVTIENGRKKALAKANKAVPEKSYYYDHKTGEVVDYDPTLDIVDDEWHYKVIDPEHARNKSLEPIRKRSQEIKEAEERASKEIQDNLVILSIGMASREKGLVRKGDSWVDKDGSIVALFDFSKLMDGTEDTFLSKGYRAIAEKQQFEIGKKNFDGAYSQLEKIVADTENTKKKVAAALAKPAKPKAQKYGHKFEFVKKLVEQMPKAPEGTRWSIATKVMTERLMEYTHEEWIEHLKQSRQHRFSVDQNEIIHDVNDVYLTMALVDKDGNDIEGYWKKENISRFVEYGMYGHNSSYTFAEAYESEYDHIKEAASRASNRLWKNFLQEAKNIKVKYEQRTIVPEVESYII